MRVGVVDPYLDTLGGGERYTLAFAEYLSRQGHQVDIFWDDQRIKQGVKRRFNIDLGKIKFVEDIFSSRINLIRKWEITRRYDLFFYLSDGSIPFLFAKNNILHFQVPFKNVGGRAFLNKLKLMKFNYVVCNSKFTKKYIDQEYGVNSRVIYPPVGVDDFQPGKKENIILSVGRFTQALHAKKQHILIEVFRKMSDQGLKNWRLVLLGGTLKGDESYVNALEKSASGYPIEIRTNTKFIELRNYYSRAKVYWHASGFGEDESEYPERMEHFGITVVEAMAAGCMPVVIDKGGIPEIVDDKKNGFLWKTKSELEKLTLQLVKSPNLRQKLSSQAIKDSQKFSQKIFCQKIDELIKD